MLNETELQTAELAKKAKLEKIEMQKHFLKECKCFVKLAEGREEVISECKKNLLYDFAQKCFIGGGINSDFIAGARHAMECLEEYPKLYKQTEAELISEGAN